MSKTKQMSFVVDEKTIKLMEQMKNGLNSSGNAGLLQKVAASMQIKVDSTENQDNKTEASESNPKDTA